MSEIKLNIKVALKVAEEHDTVLDRTIFSESSNETYGECAYQDKTTEFLQAILDAPEGVHPEDVPLLKLFLDPNNDTTVLNSFVEFQAVLQSVIDRQEDLVLLRAPMVKDDEVACHLMSCYLQNSWGSEVFGMRVSFTYSDQHEDCRMFINGDRFKPGTLRQILAHSGYPILEGAAKEAYLNRIRGTLEIQRDLKFKQVYVEGPVYVPPIQGSTPVRVVLPKGKHRAIVDDEIDLSDKMWYDRSGADGVFPWVRVFLLDFKAFVSVPVERVQKYEYNKEAFDKVVLPEKTSSLLKKIFLPKNSSFADLFQGRHGGTVVLADGPPGVGKTLTAEAIAELSEKPLYTADVAEIGVRADYVESSLKEIMNRATTWDAVLLLDEADIFLTKRDMQIERNAIVGTFLKFLDHFSGTLFLTTNRVETLDPAFASRITARIHYPALNLKSREEIWSRMLTAAGITLEGHIDVLAAQPYNGRQIRNLVRLTRMYFDSDHVSVDDILTLDENVLKVEEVWD